MQLFHGGNQQKPMCDIEIPQPTGTILYVRLQMKDRITVLGVAAARNLYQSLHQWLRLAHHQLGNNLVMQTNEQLEISRQKPAIKKRDGKLNVVGIKPVTF